MKIKFVQTYYKEVVPSWYNSDFLSGEGTLKEQIAAYELERAKRDGMYLMNMKPGEVDVEVITEDDREAETENNFSEP